MTHSSVAELRALRGQLDEARTAEIPDLVEIRRCRDLWYERLADRALEIMEASKVRHTRSPFQAVNMLRVINNDSPLQSAPRGICSPVKTKEIRIFEDEMRIVFGKIESCTTAWLKL